MLTQGRVRELFDYREDGELIWKASLGCARAAAIAGTLRKDGYRKVNVDGRAYLSHRLVFLYHHGYMPENQVDHVDRDPRNNRIDNLREVGKICNSRNAKVSVVNTSGVTGVSWNSKGSKWHSQVRVIGRQINLGLFQDFTEAVAHRLAAEQCLNWEGCHNSTSAYLYMQKYLDERKQNESEGNYHQEERHDTRRPPHSQVHAWFQLQEHGERRDQSPHP